MTCISKKEKVGFFSFFSFFVSFRVFFVVARCGFLKKKKEKEKKSKLPTHLRRLEPLPHVQVRARLVHHVHVSLLRRHHRDRKPLQLPARQVLDVAVEDLLEVERLEQILRAPAPGVLGLDDRSHVAPHGLGDVIDVLGFDRGDEVVLEDAREIVLELGAADVGEDLLPVFF